MDQSALVLQIASLNNLTHALKPSVSVSPIKVEEGKNVSKICSFPHWDIYNETSILQMALQLS